LASFCEPKPHKSFQGNFSWISAKPVALKKVRFNLPVKIEFSRTKTYWRQNLTFAFDPPPLFCILNLDYEAKKGYKALFYLD